MPAGSVIEVELVQSISSKSAKPGDTFQIRLAAPIVAGDQVVVPAGVTGVGQVVDAAASGPLGRPAKLLLAARSLDLKGAKLPLRSLKLGGAGSDPTNTILAASLIPYAGLLAGFMHGGEIEIPAGVRALAKVAVDLDAAGLPVVPGTTPSHP